MEDGLTNFGFERHGNLRKKNDMVLDIIWVKNTRNCVSCKASTAPLDPARVSVLTRTVFEVVLKLTHPFLHHGFESFAEVG